MDRNKRIYDLILASGLLNHTQLKFLQNQLKSNPLFVNDNDMLHVASAFGLLTDAQIEKLEKQLEKSETEVDATLSDSEIIEDDDLRIIEQQEPDEIQDVHIANLARQIAEEASFENINYDEISELVAQIAEAAGIENKIDSSANREVEVVDADELEFAGTPDDVTPRRKIAQLASLLAKEAAADKFDITKIAHLINEIANTTNAESQQALSAMDTDAQALIESISTTSLEVGNIEPSEVSTETGITTSNVSLADVSEADTVEPVPLSPASAPSASTQIGDSTLSASTPVNETTLSKNEATLPTDKPTLSKNEATLPTDKTTPSADEIEEEILQHNEEIFKKIADANLLSEEELSFLWEQTFVNPRFSKHKNLSKVAVALAYLTEDEIAEIDPTFEKTVNISDSQIIDTRFTTSISLQSRAALEEETFEDEEYADEEYYEEEAAFADETETADEIETADEAETIEPAENNIARPPAMPVIKVVRIEPPKNISKFESLDDWIRKHPTIFVIMLLIILVLILTAIVLAIAL